MNQQLSSQHVLVRALCALTIAIIPASAFSQTPPPGMLPYIAVDRPEFVRASDATFLLDDDILIGVEARGVARAYPAADLAQHGSVNDELPDGPIEVTWCGVCNTGVVFRSVIKGRRLHFDYDSMVGANEVDKDRETGSRWQQSTGQAISGPLMGNTLALYPFVRTTWKEWKRRYPSTAVLKPLPGYADVMPRLSQRIKSARLSGPAPAGAFGRDDRLPPREIVAGLQIGSASAAYPFGALREVRVANDRVGSVPVLIVHQPSSDTTTAFDSRVKGQTLRFEAKNPDASALVDVDTHSTWDPYGRCVAGRLKDTQLKPLILVPEFWFAWSEFHPGTSVFTARQVSATNAVWETLMRAPVPSDAVPNLTVVSLSPRATQGTLGTGHTHPGPVFGYIWRGEVENQVRPDPPATYTAGQVFYEAPGHVHIVMRNTSQTEPATVLAFLTGNTGGANPAVKLLAEVQFASLRGEDVVLRRLTLPPGAQLPTSLELPAIVGVVRGEILMSGAPNSEVAHGEGDMFVLAPNRRLTFRNASGSTAEILFYQVAEK